MNPFAPPSVELNLGNYEFGKKDSWDINQKDGILPNPDQGSFMDYLSEVQIKTIKSKLSHLHILSIFFAILKWFALFCVAMMVYDFLQKDSIFIIANSNILTLLFMGFLLILSRLFSNLSTNYRVQREELCKKELIQPRLQKFINILR